MSQPNVLWIFGDQHRAQALGCNGDPNIHTPNIDRLASSGLTCDGAVGGSPLCSPYRGSLLTGRYPHHAVPGHEYAVPDGMPTVAEPFNQANYHTAYFGKWHIDGFKEREGRAAFHTIPRHRRGGFKSWLGYENNNAQWDCHVHGHDESGQEIAHYRLPGFETDELTNLTLDYLRTRAGDGAPFFCALSVQPPHDPYEAPEEWMRRHTPGGVQLRANVPQVASVVERARRSLAGYYAMIENLDWNVGRIMTALAETQLIENTHVIFFSDHGDMHGSHGQFLKTNPYEESVRVPFIMGGFGGTRYGVRTGRAPIPMNHVDIGPTSLGLCGIDAPGWMAGTDYSHRRLPNRTPAKQDPDSAYLQLCIPTRHGDSTDRPWRGIVTTDGWKYICLEHQPWMMFNLNDDPYEQVNLAHNSRWGAKRKQLHDRLAKWVADTDDQFALPTDV